MEIKSNFKDYYDYALSGITNEINKDIVYARILDIIPYDRFSLKASKKDSLFLSTNETTTYNSNFYLLFDNEFYSGIQKLNIKKEHWSTLTVLDKEYIYDKEVNVPENIKKEMLELGKNNPIVVLKAFNEVQKTCPDNNLPWTLQKDKRDKLIENKTKIVMTNELVNSPQYTINDSLKNIQFNKIMDATQVYQKIESFINRLNSIEKEIEFNDIEKRDQHGFDECSFRNM